MRGLGWEHARQNAIAYLALLIALGTGSAYAAGRIGASDIRPNAVRSKHIASGQVRPGDTASALGLNCPDGTVLVEGACIEAVARAAEDHTAAANACTAAHGRLPSPSELQSLDARVSLTAQEWTGVRYVDLDDGSSAVIRVIVAEGGLSGSDNGIVPSPFRCVVAPLD